jgi:hypothetical protein
MATKTKAAPKQPSRKTEDKAQYERFREAARDLGTDDSPEAFDRQFRKVVPPKALLNSSKGCRQRG